MSYQSLYRKYRSQTFGDLIGQDHVVKTIQNGIASGRIAHAYLFTGPRGTGKTSTARLLAKALCCESGPTPEPDNTCEICRDITVGSCVDVVEMDAASESGVDDIREQIVEVTEYQPMVCRYKIFIIDEVHDLSAKAFDALLKTIEEPPPHIIFILATTEYNKVPPTIRSRCQKYEFHRASMQDLIRRLTHVAEHEGVQAEPAAITAIARMADGGYRDALTLLEQAMLTSTDNVITLQQVYDQLGLVSEEAVDGLLLAIREADVPAIMRILADIARLGRDPRSILESAMYRLQDLTLASYQAHQDLSDAAREASLHETSTRLGREFILRMRGDLAEAHKAIRDISLPRLWLESELLRLSQPRSAAPAPVAAAPAAPRPAKAPEPVRQEAARPATPRPPDPSPTPTPKEEPVAAVGMPAVLEGDSPEAVWSRVLASLPVKDGQPAAITKKARAATLIGLEGQELVIEVPRRMDAEWFTDDIKRIALLNRHVQAQGGEGWMIRVRASANGSSSLGDESSTVELPAEGERLEELARKVFGV
ncbi:DNA polymerase III subunit gamma/tau [Fimbriimonas ginsengisoli]|uniref:DNA polymerase III subunit gamma/tau n=1 Tax=Fimbriimonas ginsengisoli Gsoil 348 TaxID=661478 RepID=A0A068NYM3_FIMGI|nr:DNA polymerase III subunit gamma/tau [Fimbriimonas ginsengisoli]AIE87074.1 DNA polymerase III subunit gamma/tau [Fimbriimonas ginsengisoli Gsoil 348]